MPDLIPPPDVANVLSRPDVTDALLDTFRRTLASHVYEALVHAVETEAAELVLGAIHAKR